MQPSFALRYVSIALVGCSAGGDPDPTGTDGSGGATGATTDSSSASMSVGGGFGSSSSSGSGGAASCTPGSGTAGVDCASVGIQLQPPYDVEYSCLDLGTDANIPPKWGGLTTKLSDPNVLLIGGNANYPEGQLFERGIFRDAECHIAGFTSQAATLFADAPYNDGGVLYGPGDVLFLARWPVNEIGFIPAGGTTVTKVIDTEALGVAYSLAAIGFVPTGFGGAGQMKFVSWSGGEFYTATHAADTQGTYDVTGVTLQTTIVGGPEGFVYIEAGSPQFAQNGMLVAEWSANSIAAYDVDGSGNPVPSSRRDFLLGLEGAEGAFLDPMSGDFLFSTFATVNRVIAIRGFKPPPPIPQ